MAGKIKSRMNWTNFPIKFLKAVLYGHNTPENLKPEIDYDDKNQLAPYMDSVFTNPEYFVKKYRNEIEDYFFSEENHLKSVVVRLQNMNYSGIHEDTPEKMLFNLKQKVMTQSLINAYKQEIIVVGIEDTMEFKTKFPRPVSINLEKSTSVKIPLYDYQEKAVEALKKHFIDENKTSGILQMPTGSGKTRTSVYFLLTEMIPRGYQVIWLAHRSMLIEQAAETFYKFAPLIKDNRDNKLKTFNMICVSSEHSHATQINKKDNLIISTTQSLYYSKRRIKSILQPKVIIVIDEAHHSTAYTYQTLIESFRKNRPDFKLLGLSATPVRSNDKDTQNLWKTFKSNKAIYDMTMNKLIDNGTLSKPIPTRIETNIDIKTIIDNEEIAYIQKKSEMPESLINKIAKTNTRNELIVDEYIRNEEKYGKTIIFALNGIHCMALDDAFKKRGIKSGFIYSYNKNNAEIIKRFKDNNRSDHIDVLININILTEGSDIPDIQTVFLTRPTSSDVLLMQMVGRGMRGLASGGTATVNIVDFCDKWSDIKRWFNPKFLFNLDDKPVDNEKPEYTKYDYQLWPWDLIRAVMNGITYKGATIISSDTVLPIGWYNIIDENGNDEQILVFDNQIASYNKLKDDIKNISDHVKDIDFNARELLIKYFSDFGVMPTEDDLQDLVKYFKNENKFPELQTFEQRDKFDPYIIASNLKDKPQPFSETIDQIYKIYDENQEMINNLYGSKEIYKEKVVDFMQYPNGVKPLGTAIEEVEKEFYKLDPEPFDETLDKLLDEVITEQSENIGKNFVRPSIYWTNHNVKPYFAAYKYRKEYKDDFIIVNKLLNSKSIPRDVLKFVIYHECLHQRLKKHDVVFRELEQKYPNFHEYDNFLNRKFPDFIRDYDM